MNALIAEFRISILITLILIVLCCGLYPLAVWGIAQAAFPDKANGSLIETGGAIVGSSLIAQGFTGPGYFHPRPSAAGKGYDAAASSGTNLGPLSKTLTEAIAQRIAAYRTDNGLAPDAPVPADAVTCSASGLDPHISEANAELQAQRVARARGLDRAAILLTIAAHTEGRDLGLFGEPRVNVLLLNLDLDGAKQ